jgi:hypothetical protein
MKFTAVAKANKKAESIVGILFLIVLSSGCGVRVEQKTTFHQCRRAEQAVARTQQDTNNAIQKLAKGKQEKTTKNSSPDLESLQNAEEKAFEVCNDVD